MKIILDKKYLKNNIKNKFKKLKKLKKKYKYNKYYIKNIKIHFYKHIRINNKNLKPTKIINKSIKIKKIIKCKLFFKKEESLIDKGKDKIITPKLDEIKKASCDVEKYNVKFCVFLGREKNLKILHPYIELGLKDNILNEYHMFDFSRNMNDHNFIKEEYIRLNLLFENRIFLHNYEENGLLLLKNTRTKTNWNPFYKKISESNENDIISLSINDEIFTISNIDNHPYKLHMTDNFDIKIKLNDVQMR